MDLTPLLRREPVVPFAPEARLPWDDPAFSARVLREHLSQAHDRASRRHEIVARQVAWIHQVVLGGKPGRILDLGCGPGLHTGRLAQLGHRCVGVDFSPAAIAHARRDAQRAGHDCRYLEADIRQVALETGFDLVMMLFGEFNTLAPADAEALLARLPAALSPSGRIVLEPHYEDYVCALGEAPPTWSAQDAGLFADEPHLTLHESQWHPSARATTERYWVFVRDAPPATYTQSTRAWSDEELDALIERCGLVETGRYESLTGDPAQEAELFGLVIEAR